MRLIQQPLLARNTSTKTNKSVFMFSKIYTAQLRGLTPELVCIETDISKGLHSFSIIGLADKAVEEARDRINAAIKNSGFKAPAKGNKKIIIALAPAGLQKSGSHFDVGLALSYLQANKDIKFDSEKKIFLGELSLDGQIQPIKGVLLITKMIADLGFKEIYVPEANTKEASLIRSIKVYGVKNLKDLVTHLSPQNSTSEPGIQSVHQVSLKLSLPTKLTQKNKAPEIDFSDVRSQREAKRALIIAAAGGHNVAMVGTPGTGKSMLAKAFSGILPPLSFDEILETSGIHSAVGLTGKGLVTEPPFRAPHHTSSYVSLIGGGSFPKPGEITLAHKGVLFLDEFPEFDKKVIESLRQPLEEHFIIVSRSKGTNTFPAHFILITAMNPCPCGYKNSKYKECICGPAEQNRYRRKISGPIIDRIDVWVNVPEIKHETLLEKSKDETSFEIKKIITRVRDIQSNRFKNENIKTNSEMNSRLLEKYTKLNNDSIKILNEAAKRLGLSARSYHRVIKLARTIADLDNQDNIETKHILEAIQYRPNLNL